MEVEKPDYLKIKKLSVPSTGLTIFLSVLLIAIVFGGIFGFISLLNPSKNSNSTTSLNLVNGSNPVPATVPQSSGQVAGVSSSQTQSSGKKLGPSSSSSSKPSPNPTPKPTASPTTTSSPTPTSTPEPTPTPTPEPTATPTPEPTATPTPEP